MADWTFETTDALAEAQWANEWWREAKPESFFYGHGFVGPNENSDIIVEFPDLMEKQGYSLTFGQSETCPAPVLKAMETWKVKRKSRAFMTMP